MKFERARKNSAVAQLRRCAGICVNGLKKTTGDLSQCSRDLSPGPSEYEGRIQHT
jgi:hypothetical protein